MIGGDFDTPVMYQDLGKYSNGMPMFGAMTGMTGMYGNTSYLGGIQMKPQPDQDKIQLMNKKDEEGKSTFKKAMIGIGVCLALGFIPYFRKNIKKAGGLWNCIKNLFAKTPTAPAKPSKWKNFKGWCGTKWNGFKNIFKKKTPSTPPSGPSRWQRFKTWSGAKWNSFKNLFKKRTPTPTP